MEVIASRLFPAEDSQIHSGKATLLTQGVDKIITNEQSNIIFTGTSVSSRINCGDESLIEQALVFKGQTYHPSNDYLESHYELGDEKQYVFLLKEEAPGFGTREAGRVV